DRLTGWSRLESKPCNGGSAMTSRVPGPAGDRGLVEDLVEASVRGGKVKPALPAGRRDEFIAALTRLMVNRPLLEEFKAALTAERRRLGVDDVLLELASPERPVEEIAGRGLSV